MLSISLHHLINRAFSINTGNVNIFLFGVTIVLILWRTTCTLIESENTFKMFYQNAGLLIYNIFVVFRELIFQQIVRISMVTNYASLLTGLFCSFEVEIIQNVLKDKKKRHVAKFVILISCILMMSYHWITQISASTCREY